MCLLKFCCHEGRQIDISGQARNYKCDKDIITCHVYRLPFGFTDQQNCWLWTVGGIELQVSSISSLKRSDTFKYGSHFHCVSRRTEWWEYRMKWTSVITSVVWDKVGSREPLNAKEVCRPLDRELRWNCVRYNTQNMSCDCSCVFTRQTCSIWCIKRCILLSALGVILERYRRMIPCVRLQTFAFSKTMQIWNCSDFQAVMLLFTSYIQYI